ncbi:hypothetical protein GCM10009533_31820 [Saccharopolyspora spinosporotrichia]|uniref:Transposase n=1 Tax=Saccharopolyspora erythraea TaxID=1836 RepID=A0ABN1D0A9_SACER
MGARVAGQLHRTAVDDPETGEHIREESVHMPMLPGERARHQMRRMGDIHRRRRRVSGVERWPRIPSDDRARVKVAVRCIDRAWRS